MVNASMAESEIGENAEEGITTVEHTGKTAEEILGVCINLTSSVESQKGVNPA